jgi:hypothetical protein
MGIEADGMITCDVCGLPIDDPGMGMVIWDVHTYDEQTRESKRRSPRVVRIVHKGPCDRLDFITWWELRDFLNPEGFARWVNDRIRALLPEEEALVNLIDSMWPLVLRNTTPAERKMCRDRLEFGMWRGRAIKRLEGA